VRWEGSSERTWEPLRHFFHLYSHPILEYCLQHDLRVRVRLHRVRGTR
jgi:hypothetical protein